MQEQKKLPLKISQFVKKGRTQKNQVNIKKISGSTKRDQQVKKVFFKKLVVILMRNRPNSRFYQDKEMCKRNRRFSSELIVLTQQQITTKNSKVHLGT